MLAIYFSSILCKNRTASFELSQTTLRCELYQGVADAAGTEDSIKLPLDLVIIEGGLPALINFIYPCLTENYENVNYMVGKAILTPKNVDVKKIFMLVLERLPGDFTIYSSADSVDLSDDDNASQPQVYSPEFLRSLKIPDLLSGELKLKVGAPIILLHHLKIYSGFQNKYTKLF